MNEIPRDFDAEGRLAYAVGLEMRDEIEPAISGYEELIAAGDQIENEAYVKKHLGNLHMRVGNLLKARSLLNESCELEPGNAAFWHDLGAWSTTTSRTSTARSTACASPRSWTPGS